MKRTLVIFFALALCSSALTFFCSDALADGEQEKSTREAGDEKPGPKDAADAQRKIEAPKLDLKEDGKEEEDEGDWNTFLGCFFGVVFEGIGTTVYDVVIRDHGFRYHAYPYSSEKYAFYDPDTDPRGAPGVLRLEYQRMNPRFYGLTERLTLRMGSGFDLSLVNTLYDEKSRFDDHERTHFTRLRMGYLRSPASGNILMRSGMGVASIAGRSGLDVGFEVDCFLSKPFVFRGGFSQIFVMNHKGVTEYDFSLGVIAGPFEFALGYRGVVMKRNDINGIYFSSGFWF